MKGMILTAGLGTRLKPLTDVVPKPLLRVGEYRMLDLSIAFLKKHGVSEFIINVHHLADQLMEYVLEKRKEGNSIEISNETSELLNTGGGLKKASWFFEGEQDFVLMASDILTDLNLTRVIQEHKSNQALVTLAVKKRNTSRDLIFDSDNHLAGWRNNQTGQEKKVTGKTGGTGFGFSGIHVINTNLFSKIIEEGSFSIIDLYLRLAESEKIMGFDHSDGKWLEFGRLENLEDLEENEDFNELINTII